MMIRHIFLIGIAFLTLLLGCMTEQSEIPEISNTELKKQPLEDLNPYAEILSHRSKNATVNNYTDMGLLDIVAKQHRVRMYDAARAKERLTMIGKLISEGYTLRVIGKLLR